MNTDASRFNRVDVHVGSRLAQRRLALGYTLAEVAAAAQVSLQQMERFERGEERINAANLYILSNFLDIPFSYFFERFKNKDSGNLTPEDAADAMHIFVEDPAALVLLRAFNQLQHVRQRQAIVALVESIAAPSSRPATAAPLHPEQ